VRKIACLLNLNYEEEINRLFAEINAGGKVFIQQYFDLLHKTELSE